MNTYWTGATLRYLIIQTFVENQAQTYNTNVPFEECLFVHLSIIIALYGLIINPSI